MNCHVCRLGVTATIAIAVSLALMEETVAQSRASGAAASTPRMADGKPDFSGNWIGFLFDVARSRRCAPGQGPCNVHYQTNQSWDEEFIRAELIGGEVWFSGRWSPNRPMYKPEFWDKVQDLDENTNTQDPIIHCHPWGIVRQGPPTKIVQTAREIILFYDGHAFRTIPIDGRKHDPEMARDISYWGHAVGHWEGETLVIDSVGFNDITWLSRGGFFHSDNMRIIEKFRREGNILHYDVTVEDPDVLLEPWVLNPRQLKLDPTFPFIPEEGPCRDYDAPNLGLSKIRH